MSIDDSEEEVFEKIKSVLQHSSVVDIEKVETSNTIQTGELVIDSAQHTVHKRMKEIILTNTEFCILYFLALNKGMAISKEAVQVQVGVFDKYN